MTQLVYLYAYKPSALQDKAYYDSGILEMLNKYHEEDGTGNAVLDSQIKKCYNEMLSDYINKLNEANRKKATAGSSQPNQMPDTRIFFTVQLLYYDNMMYAELERKGLDVNDKLEMTVEVGKE